MPGPNPAQQTQQAQQQAQQQAEQFLAQQKAQAISDWSKFFQTGSPAQHWAGIQNPSFAGSPAAIGGGMVGGSGGIRGAFPMWTPTPPGGTPEIPLPRRDIDRRDIDKAKPPGGGGGQGPPPRGGGGGQSGPPRHQPA